MTDILSEAYGRDLIARTTFEKEGIWLPLLSVHHLNAGLHVISGKTFTDCAIEGPAVMAIVNGVTFEGCNMGVASDPTSLFFKGQGSILTGVIGFADTKFIRCRFVQVGFTGHPDAVDQMANELVSARAIMDASAN